MNVSEGVKPDSGSLGMYGREEVSVWRLAAILLRHRHMIVLSALVTMLVTTVPSLVTPRSFSAVASFLPQTVESRPSPLATLAGQFGIDVSVGQDGESPAFYGRLLGSSEILGHIATDTIAFWLRDDRGDSIWVAERLADILEIEGGNDALRVDGAMQWLLAEAVRVSVDQETGIVEARVQTSLPGLSSAIANRLLELVNEFNLERRQSRATAERQFLGGRLNAARAELERGEEDLKGFLGANRDFRNSPELLFEHDRLQREVTMRQELYASLMQSFESARVTEVRNTPVITVVEQAKPPLRPDGRQIPLKAAMGLALGLLGGAVLALVRDRAKRAREEAEEEYVEFSRAARDAVAQLGSISRVFKGH